MKLLLFDGHDINRAMNYVVEPKQKQTQKQQQQQS
jgi:hypothetical protein